MPESSDSAGRPVALAAACALIRALPTNVVSVSSGRTYNGDPAWREKLLHLFKLAGVVCRDEDTVRGELAGHSVASFWIATSSVTPFSARSISAFI